MIINFPTHLYLPFSEYISLKVSSIEPFKQINEIAPFINSDIKSTILIDEIKYELVGISTQNYMNIPLNEFFNIDDIEFSDEMIDIPELLDIDISSKKNIYGDKYLNKEKLIRDLKNEILDFIQKINAANNIYYQIIEVNRNLSHITAIDQASEFTGEDVKQEINLLNEQKTILLNAQENLKGEISDIISKIKKLKNVL
jgi:hypothetical protein